MFGCGAANPVVPPAPGNTYQIVTISDLHFNPLYDPSLLPQLASSPESQWSAIYKTSKVTAPSSGGTDTNYALLSYTLESLHENAKNSPVVLFTGDVLGHNIPPTYCTIYLTSQNTPVNNTTIESCMASQSPAIQQFISDTFAFVASEIQTAVGGVPVLYAPGNIDAYSGTLGPDPNFLTTNQPFVWSELLEEKADATFADTFPTGGYYFFQYFPKNAKTSPLRIIVLNTNSFVAASSTVKSPTFGTAPRNFSGSILNSRPHKKPDRKYGF
jgi:hypothetical protein